MAAEGPGPERRPAQGRVSGSVQISSRGKRPGSVGLLLFAIAAVSILALAFVLLFAAIAAGVVLIGGALALYAFRRATGRLATAEELAARHGVTPREMERLIEQEKLTPNVVINGKGLYDPRDLKDAGRLLRAAGGPVVDAELSRPASGTVKDERLLTPAKPEPTNEERFALPETPKD